MASPYDQAIEGQSFRQEMMEQQESIPKRQEQERLQMPIAGGAPDNFIGYQSGETTNLEKNWRLDVSKTISDIRANLKGCVWDDETGRYVNVSEQSMNDIGVNEITMILNYYLGNKDARLSNLSIDHVNRLSFEARQKIRHKLILNKDRFGITHNDVIMTLTTMLSHAIFLALRRSFDDGERTHLDSGEKVIRHEQYLQQDMGSGQQRKGFLSNFKGL